MCYNYHGTRCKLMLVATARCETVALAVAADTSDVVLTVIDTATRHHSYSFVPYLYSGTHICCAAT
jgi:hypothetical protein